MKFFQTTPIVVLLLFLLIFIPLNNLQATEISQQERQQTYQKLELFSNILSILQDNYVEEIDTDSVIEGAINGLLLSLDPHSSYLPPQSFQELQNETQGSFTGIGIEITIRDNKLTVVSPIEGTPAFEAGLQANDTIVKIEGVWTTDMSPMDAIKKLRGPKGSKVTFSVYREGWDDLKEFTLVRDVIPVRSVRALFLEKGIAYTRITNFQSRTTKDYLTELKNLQKKDTVNAIILDLRNNPGGLLNQAVSVADIFVDSGLIVYTKGRREEQNMVFEARESGSYSATPLIVLVNEGSASASEIVAGAIQDQKRGLIVGTQTFGKGSVQTIVPLQNGAGLRMTTARYYTPSGKSIQVKGITPDITIDYKPINAIEENGAEEGSSTREGDLKNHFRNPSLKSDRQTSKHTTEQTSSSKSTEEMEFIDRLRNDNQVQMALNIIKGISLLSEEPEEQQ
ncbi:MAG: S41 family peptidase [Desulfocapsaceae bacterium]|nr:S41 family peptidase [Desulfocapsaceae bacterium]